MCNEKEEKALRSKIGYILQKYEDSPFYEKLRRFAEEYAYKRYVNPKTYKKLANLTSKINYGCNFVDGKCKEDRTEMCCCSSCYSSSGHFQERFLTGDANEEAIEKELLYYVKKHKEYVGFWRKGKGCVLPRERRSSTCLTYNCNFDNFSIKEKLLTRVLSHSRDFPYYIDIIIDLLKECFP